MKGFFKNKQKVQLPKPTPPREIPDIQKELNQESWALGQLEYQIYVLKHSAAQKNKRIEELNYEGAERNKLDAAAKEAAAKENTQGATNG